MDSVPYLVQYLRIAASESYSDMLRSVSARSHIGSEKALPAALGKALSQDAWD
jgi:hypothetical protein